METSHFVRIIQYVCMEALHTIDSGWHLWHWSRHSIAAGAYYTPGSSRNRTTILIESSDTAVGLGLGLTLIYAYLSPTAVSLKIQFFIFHACALQICSCIFTRTEYCRSVLKFWMYLHVGFPLFYHNFHSEIVRYGETIDFVWHHFHKPVMALAPSEPRSGRNY